MYIINYRRIFNNRCRIRDDNEYNNMGCYLMSYNIVETKWENIFFFRIDNVINTIEAPRTRR